MTEISEYDAETVEHTTDRLGGPVDPPVLPTTFADIVSRTDDLRPIVPASLRSAAGRHALRTYALAYAGHATAYHTTRAPKYLTKGLVYAPRGLWRALARSARWATAEEGNWHLRQQAASRNDAKIWLDLDARRSRSAVWRWPLLAVLALLLAVLVGAVRVLVPAGDWLLTAATLVVLARLGRPADRPIIDRVTVGQRFIRLTAELTRAAVIACGAGVKDPAQLTFPREIFRDGPGHTALVELPPGIIATDVIDKRERLAGGFRLPLDQVWPDPVPGQHPGMLGIWVADRPVTSMRQPPSPLLEGGATDFFAPFAYGMDVRMRPVSWRLDERNSLFGGVPGSGKSLAARNVVLGAILDPLVIPVVSELKGSGDFDAIEPLCPEGMYISGADEQSKQRTMRLLEWLEHECDVRGPLIKGWAARGYNTENKLNRRIAEADPRLRPLVAVFDEVQELITDKELGKAAVILLTSIIKRGRSLGIHLILATQRIDKESVPKGISSNIVNRLALAVVSHVETDLILGTGAYSRGARPTAFLPPPEGPNPWAGFGVLAGMTNPIRAAYLDNAAARSIAARALTLRAGLDAPQTEKVRAYNLAEDCRTVWPVDVTALWLADLLALLRTLRPDVYGDLDTEALSAALRAGRIAPVPVHRKVEGKGHTRAGVRFEHLATALSALSGDSRPAIGSDLHG